MNFINSGSGKHIKEIKIVSLDTICKRKISSAGNLYVLSLRTDLFQREP